MSRLSVLVCEELVIARVVPLHEAFNQRVCESEGRQSVTILSGTAGKDCVSETAISDFFAGEDFLFANIERAVDCSRTLLSWERTTFTEAISRLRS